MNTLLIATALFIGQADMDKKPQPQHKMPQRTELYAELPRMMRVNRYDGSFSWQNLV